MKPILVPIIDISYYLPEFSKFNPKNLFKEEKNVKKQGVLENIKARYMGIDDPVARKIIKNYSEKNPPEPPKDKNIKMFR